MRTKVVLAFFPAFLLAACGDTVENVNQINQMGMAVVDSAKDLPKCTDENEGEQAVVKGESAIRVCIDGEWQAMSSDGSMSADFSCKTEELKDKSGLKIVCNGDSIGVVLNGAEGKQGETGVGCTISGQTDSTVTIACGDKKLTMNMDGGFSVVEAENDSEKVAISLDSLAGYTQKGPFLKGSTVYLYELSDGRTLKQTNGNFTSKITRDDGRYKFTARDLVSQYAMLVVDGFYRNEVTGQKSDASLRLTALTDMRKRSSANVNLLTHLEFDRVYHLVTRGDSTGKKLTVKQAKRQAQKEILKQFHIELDSNTDAEDMDVFGSSDADAALLAISILLQGDSGTTDLSVLLTEISNDIAEFGEWKNDSAKAVFADWAMVADTATRLDTIAKHVTDWGLGNVPDFKKFVRNFVFMNNGLGRCGSDSVRQGMVKYMSNPKSKFFASKYEDVSNGDIRYICADADSAKWRIATDIEKDTMGWGPCSEFGKIAYGRINTKFAYVCSGGRWKRFYGNPSVSYGELKDERDGQVYLTVEIGNKTWMAENLNFVYKIKSVSGDSIPYENYCFIDNCENIGRYYLWSAAMDSAGVFSTSSAGCGIGHTCTITAPARGVCPEGWHIPTADEFETLSSNSYSQVDSLDVYGFSVLHVGGGDKNKKRYGEDNAFFWSATETSSDYAEYFQVLDNNNSYTTHGYGKYNGFSVRCVKD